MYAEELMLDDRPLTKREEARKLLGELFADRQRVRISEIMEYADDRGISRRTMTRVAIEMGIHTIQNGPAGGIWERSAA